jgi:hypothetical protein
MSQPSNALVITATPVYDKFIPDPRLLGAAGDPSFGPVLRGSLRGMATISNPTLGFTQLTDGSRVITPWGNGYVSSNSGFFRRRCHDRHVDLGGVRYTLHHTSLRRAELLRDGAVIGRLRRRRAGRFFHGGWIATYDVTQWAAPADATAAAVAHLLASNFEVGAWGCLATSLMLVTLPFRILG